MTSFHLKGEVYVACENIPFSSLFAAGDVPRETSPSTKSEEKRMFSQAKVYAEIISHVPPHSEKKSGEETIFSEGGGTSVHRLNKVLIRCSLFRI